MQGRLIQGLELNYVSRDTSQRSSPSGSGGWVSNVSFGGIQLNLLHMGTFSRNRVGVPLVCISGGPRASSQTRGRSHVASRCLVGPKATLAATPGLPGCPQVEKATTAVWGPPSAERASPQAGTGLAEDGEDSPEAHLLRHCGQDLRTSASKLSLGTRWVFSADPDPPLYCGGVASPTQWTQV